VFALGLFFSAPVIISSAGGPAPGRQTAAPALAAINVNSTSDAAANDGQCTLREAITAANTDSPSGAAAGECAAGAGTDTITISVNGTINLAGALPDISTNMSIVGPGSAQLTVRRDSGGDYRIFTVTLGTSSISGLTASNGKTPNGAPGNFGANAAGGGGIAVVQVTSQVPVLSLTDVNVFANRTGAGGEGVSFGGNGGPGGGVYNAGTLTMTNCFVTANVTGAGGNGNNGAGNGGDGGGIFNVNTLTITGGSVNSNGTGWAGNTSGIGRTGGSGAGIYHDLGALNLTGTSVSYNSAGGGGSAPIGNPGFGGHGGGLYLGSGAVTLTNSTVTGNTAGPGSNGTPGYGGGISNGSALTILNSTISGNIGNAGGAILNRLALSMTNSTVSANLLSHAGGGGGAVYNSDSPSSFTVTNCTFNANSGSALIAGGSSNVVRNSILAGSTGSDASGAFTSQGHNLVGVADGSTGFGAAGDQLGSAAAPLNPRLGPLADNGGPTLTHALLAGSPALDAGNNSLAVDKSGNPLTTDQRGTGFPRVADAADADTVQTVDIGAFEAHPSVEDISNKTTTAGSPVSFSFNVGDAAHGIASVAATSGNTALVPNDPTNISVTGSGSTRTLTVTPASGTGTATITVTATGTNGRSMSDTFQLTVTAAPNQAPTLNAISDLTINEDAGTQTVNLGGISAGAGETQNLTVTAASDNTALIPHPTVTYTSPSSTGSISFAPAANQSGIATVTVTVTDDGGTANGGVNSVSRSFNVTVAAVNDAPVNTVPGSQETVQHAPVVFSAANSNAISVADVDAGADAVKVTLTGATGTITLGSNAGLTFVTGDGTGDASVSFTGTLTSVNAALNGLSFKPAQGFGGAAGLQIVTDDLGHSGSGGPLTDTDGVTINVASGGTLAFSATAYEVNETGTSVTITVIRGGGRAGAASVNYATSDVTATGGATCAAGVDYVSASGTLNWADDDNAGKTFTVTLCEDFGDVGDETLSISLSGATGSATVGAPAMTTLTIKDYNPAGGVLQFSQNGYSVAEGVVALTVTVLRSGHAATEATVDYATDDGSTPAVFVPCSSTTGLALDRCDYTKALGTLRFAVGEREKTFKVLISDDSYTEGSETAQLKLSNPTGGAELGKHAAAVITITDDSPESSGNPIDDATKFVTQQYHDFLNRDPDAEGLAFWVGGITVCGANAQCREVKRIDTSAAFFLSIEFQNTGYFVERTYKTAFGDATSPGVPGTVPIVRLDEFLRDTQRIGRDVIVNQGDWEARLAANKGAYALEFIQRQRFQAAFPGTMTAAEFVAKLDENAGGVLSADERAQLTALLAPDPPDPSRRAAVLRQVAEDQTLVERERNRAFVLMQYFGYLRRNPDDAPEKDLNYAGWRFWLDKLDAFGGDYRRAEMVKAFISSDEYRRRFGQQ
jgi:CSLREA domain-containing protein